MDKLQSTNVFTFYTYINFVYIMCIYILYLYVMLKFREIDEFKKKVNQNIVLDFFSYLK